MCILLRTLYIPLNVSINPQYRLLAFTCIFSFSSSGLPERKTLVCSVLALYVFLPKLLTIYIIRKAINTVYKQTYNNWELIIVNDGSNDYKTSIFMQEWGEIIKEEKKIKYMRFKYNYGQAFARNEAFLLSSGVISANFVIVP